MNWLSVPVGVGQATAAVVWCLTGTSVEEPFVLVARVVGVLAFGVFAVRQWWAARDTGADAVRRAGVMLVLFALLAPATLPWYYTWGPVLLAATTWSVRRLQVAVVGSVSLIVVSFPSGEFAVDSGGYLILMGAGALLAAYALASPDPLGSRGRSASAGRA